MSKLIIVQKYMYVIEQPLEVKHDLIKVNKSYLISKKSSGFVLHTHNFIPTQATRTSSSASADAGALF